MTFKAPTNADEANDAYESNEHMALLGRQMATAAMSLAIMKENNKPHLTDQQRFNILWRILEPYTLSH